MAAEEVLLDLGRGSGQFPLSPGIWSLWCGLGQGSLPSGQRPSPEPLPRLLRHPQEPLLSPICGAAVGTSRPGHGHTCLSPNCNLSGSSCVGHPSLHSSFIFASQS